MSWLAVQIILLILFTMSAAFFAGAEVAYTGLNMSNIKRIHILRPGFFATWERRPDLVLAVLLLSNNAISTAVGVLAAHMGQEITNIFSLKESISTFSCSLITGTFLLIFGEIIPKVYAKQFTLSWALSVTPIMNFWTKILSPIARACLTIINKILQFQRDKTTPYPISIEAELKSILEHSTIPVASKKILDNVIGFSRSKTREIMVPRAQILALSLRDPMNKIIESVIQSGYSRFPVYSGNFDNMVGVLYSKDLLVSWRSHTLVLLEDLLRPIYSVEEGQLMGELLRIFRSGRHHLAIVKDNLQKGRVTGLITLQDALEALVGPIKEEL